MKKITLLCIAISMSVFSNGITNALSTKTAQSATTTNNEIQRVRIDFVSPDGYTRHLLLSFTPDNAATDGFDYGYDGRNADNFANDLNWMIEDDRFVIQGVGAFDETKHYPFGMFLADSGDIEISLASLENFDAPINVFIYDALLDTYTQINDFNYASNIESGEYLNRFYIAFFNSNETNTEDNSELLSTNDNELNNTVIKYLSNSKELFVNTLSTNKINQINIYNLLGQKLTSINEINSSETKIQINHFATNYVIAHIETDFGSIARKIIIQ